MLICVFVMSLVAVGTAAVLGEGRVLRERARQRAELALIAQGELDRLRTQPIAQLTAGWEAIRRDEWPANVSATVAIERRTDGYWQLSVQAERRSPGGDRAVALTTIHPGGRR
jgi:hypothetical protein